MKNDTGFIKIGIALLIIALAFSGVLFLTKTNFTNYPKATKTSKQTYTSTPAIKEPVNFIQLLLPENVTKTAYIETSKGNIELASTTYGINKLDKPDINYNIYNLYEFKNSIYFTKSNILNRLNKTTREITEYRLPYLKDQGPNAGLVATVEELDSKTAFIVVQLFELQYGGEPYMLNLESKIFTPIYLEGSVCKMCGAPSVEANLSANNLLLIQGGGDACWGAGNIYLYNIDENKAEQILEYQNGCYDEKPAYTGIVNNKLVIAKHKGDIYLNLMLLDPFAKKTTEIINEQSMPKDIEVILPDKEKGLIYMQNSEGKWYSYNVGKNSISEINDGPIQNQQEEKEPVYKIKEETTKLGTIKKVVIKDRDESSQYQHLEVTDDKGLVSDLMEIRYWQKYYDQNYIKGEIPDCELWSDYYFKEAKLEGNKVYLTIGIKPQNQIMRCHDYHKPDEEIKSYVELHSGNIFVY